ncbi:hypothetical protein C8Q80DRAFT_225726 [Daedaleopsis nitida]|nr:hypothetical protein C8Q80DRAFT_225726 [Daedaleopsis nitida]
MVVHARLSSGCTPFGGDRCSEHTRTTTLCGFRLIPCLPQISVSAGGNSDDCHPMVAYLVRERGCQLMNGTDRLVPWPWAMRGAAGTRRYDSERPPSIGTKSLYLSRPPSRLQVTVTLAMWLMARLRTLACCVGRSERS